MQTGMNWAHGASYSLFSHLVKNCATEQAEVCSQVRDVGDKIPCKDAIITEKEVPIE